MVLKYSRAVSGFVTPLDQIRSQMAHYGSMIRVGYADTNGHPYRSIGRVLIEVKAELALDFRAVVNRARLPGRPDMGPDQAGLRSRESRSPFGKDRAGV